MRTKITTLLKNPLFSGSLVMIVGSMGVNVINYVYHLLMGRMLGPSEYGILASVYSVLYIISIVPQSASITIVKFISSAKKDSERSHIYYRIQKIVNKVSIGGSILLLVLAPFIQQFLNINSIWPVIWSIPVFYFSILTIANQATLQGVLAFFDVVVTNFITSAGKLVVGITLVLLGMAAGGAVFAVGAGVALSFYLSRHYVKRFVNNPSEEETDFDIKKFIKYSGPVIVQSLAFTSLFTVDLVLVKHFFPDFDAGLYAALSTLGKIIFFAASPITAVMFPLVARKKSAQQSGLKVFILSLGVTILVSFGIAGFYYLFPSFTIGLLYGEKYLSAAQDLVWMGMFIAIYTVCQQIVNYFLSVEFTQIVILPLIAAIGQIVVIYLVHPTILSVMQISTVMCFVLSLSLIGVGLYNRKKFI